MWSDDDSGFRDDSSITFSEDASSQFSYKTKTWNCFSTNKQRAKTRGYEEAIPLSKPPRREKFLKRVTRKIFGKNRKKFWKKRNESEGGGSQVKQTSSDLYTERQSNTLEPIETYTNTQQISLLVDNVEPFRRDQLRQTDSWEPRKTYTNTQQTSFFADSEEPFHPNELRCSIRVNTSHDSQTAPERFRAEEEHAMLRVLFDFDACEENDVSVRRGELVKVLNKDDDDWWWVENVQRSQGFVPKNFLWPCGCYGKFIRVYTRRPSV